MVLGFGDYELDLGRVELRARGVPVPMEPQVFDVLAYLVTHRDRLVTKEELLDNVWGNRFVSESALTTRIKAARRAVGDDGTQQHTIRTIHGRGFRFIAEVVDVAPSTAIARAAVDDDVPRFVGPVPLTALIGREHELTHVSNLIRRERLVSLLGAGGIGKTRLATEVAARLAQEFAGGAVFVDLTTIRDPARLGHLVATALGTHADDDIGAVRAIEEATRRRPTLVVLDNFEHVIDAAPFVADLVRSAPAVSVLVTSRERLRVSGEHVVDVDPLALESTVGEPAAMALFTHVAQSVDATFRLDDANRADVEGICRTLDGLPLGIELAARQVRALPTALLRARLRSRLETHAGSLRDQPPRHRTIGEAIGWSVQLLTRDERAAFVRASVFAGPVPWDAVAAIVAGACTDPEGAVAALVDKSLLRRVTSADGSPRFTMLEPVREWARSLLEAEGAAHEVAHLHAGYVVEWLDAIEEARWRSGNDHWIDAITEIFVEVERAGSWA